MSNTRTRKVLVTGASIAGPTLAYWLERYGFEVTLVERAQTIRSGGYAIDVRGPAIDVVERMGLLPMLRDARVTGRHMTVLNAKGREVVRIGAGAIEDNARHLGVLRGDLTSLLYDRTRTRVDYRFGDAIASVSDDADGVDVTFTSGARGRFDLILSGEGLHSSTRRIVFGPEQAYSRYLGNCFAVCEIPNTYGLQSEVVLFNKPGKGAALHSANDGPTVFAFFVHWRPPPSAEEIADSALQRESIACAFPEDTWLLPRMIAAMREAEEVYFDATMQIRMPAWSKGRVTLVGDAAYAPSFFTGQGTSMALVGAYVLAGALAASADHKQAFRTYEDIMRPWIKVNQDIVELTPLAAPRTASQIWIRNAMFRLAPLLGRLGPLARSRDKAYEGMVLPEFTVSADPRAAA